MHPRVLNASWVWGPGNLIGGATTTYIDIPLRFHDNATITFVTLNFQILTARASLPAVQPSFQIARRKISDGSVAGFLSTGVTSLAATTPTGYYAGGFVVQGISFVPDQNNVIDASQYTYYALIQDESGANSIAGNYYMGVVVTASTIPDLRFQ